MEWYYRRAGKVYGPVSARIIVELARVGRLDGDDEVRAGEQGNWQRAAQMPGLGLVQRGKAARINKPAQEKPPAAPSFWRGELPLLRSLLLYFLLPLLGLQVLIWMLAHTHPLSATLFYLLVVVALLALPWQFVGAWRSVSRTCVTDAAERPPTRLRVALIAAAALVFVNLAFLPPFQPASSGAASTVTSAVGTAATPGKLAAAPPEPASDASPMEQLEDDPALALLSRYMPVVAEQVQQMVASMPANSSSRDIWHSVNYVLAKLAVESAAFAPDDALVAYVKVALKNLQVLADESDALCRQGAFGSNDGALFSHLSREQRYRNRKAYVDLIVAAHTQPQTPPIARDVKATLQQVYAQLAKQYGKGVYQLGEPASSGLDDEALCEVAQSLYAALLRLPAQQRGPVLRYSLGS